MGPGICIGHRARSPLLSLPRRSDSPRPRQPQGGQNWSSHPGLVGIWESEAPPGLHTSYVVRVAWITIGPPTPLPCQIEGFLSIYRSAGSNERLHTSLSWPTVISTTGPTFGIAAALTTLPGSPIGVLCGSAQGESLSWAMQRAVRRGRSSALSLDRLLHGIHDA